MTDLLQGEVMKHLITMVMVTLYPLWIFCGCQSSGTTSATKETTTAASEQASSAAATLAETPQESDETADFSIDAHDAGDGYGMAVGIEDDGLYTFSITGEAQDATWELYVVNPEDGMIYEERHCRFVAQRCDQISLNQPLKIQAGSFICAIPSVNGFTVDDEEQLLPEGASVVQAKVVVQKIDQPWHCENN